MKPASATVYFDLEDTQIAINHRGHELTDFRKFIQVNGQNCQVSIDLRNTQDKILLDQIHLRRLLKNLE